MDEEAIELSEESIDVDSEFAGGSGSNFPMHKVQLQNLAIGTFSTNEASVAIHNSFLIISFLDETKTDKKLFLDFKSITKIRQKYEAGDNLINCVLRPKKVKEFAEKIPEGYTFSCSQAKSYSFKLKFHDDLDKIVAEDLQNLLSAITPVESSINWSEDDSVSNNALKRPATEINLVNDENSPPNNKKSRKSTKESSTKVDFLKKVFDDASDTPDDSLVPKKEETETRSTRPKRTTRKQTYNQSLMDTEPSDYYDGDDIPQQLLETEQKDEVKHRPTAAPKYPEFNNSDTLMSYPPGSDNIITMENYKCLDRPELIDDVILDFYIQFIYHELMSEEMRERVHICSSNFYAFYALQTNFSGWKEDKVLKASQKRYLRVKDMPCLKDVNIFEKDFIVFPCHDHDHWFLVIVCYPRLNGAFKIKDGTPVDGDDLYLNRKNPEEGDPIKRSCVLTFDSVKSNPGRRVKAMVHIRNFLKSEYDAKYQDNFAFLETDVTAHCCQCPQQSNATDCGLYLLEFIEQFFIKSPIQDFRFFIDVTDWFTPDVILQKREQIALTIQSLIVSQKGEMPLLPPISFNDQKPDVKVLDENMVTIAKDNDENNGNNNEEEFNNNNDFYAVDHNKTTSNIEIVQDSNPLEGSRQSTQCLEKSSAVEGALNDLHSKLQEQSEEATEQFISSSLAGDHEIDVPATQNSPVQSDVTQVSLPATISDDDADVVKLVNVSVEEKVQQPEMSDTYLNRDFIQIDSD